ncbi:hypothetical protein QTG54_009874 [Skeletonema marinoi]|uniref:SET domain-containing protein n=1 Tax=Skeletonema marinoi TaxID=267567 RepID=A0AAD9D9L2_9STRA|nr:hypothetical protein QTG54_009874 [Skeletonema marinoi]
MMKRTLLLSSLALLVACGTSAAAAPADYESKMQAALDNYAAHSDEILQRAIKVGNDGAAIDSVEIDANGDVTSSSSAALYAEFGSAAVNTALDRINKEIEQQDLLEETLDPEMWARFSYWDLHDFFGCEKAFDSPRPLWTDQQWYDVWDLYHEFIEEDKKDGPFTKVRAYQFSKDYMDLSQNAIPFQSGEKGRGLQAVRDIKAGEMVFKATNNTIVFNYGHTWRKLLFAVNERDPSITCDMHVWSWVQDLYDGGPMKIVMDLDSGSLLNEGRDNVKGWDPPNVQCGLPDATRCDMDYYAYRDIKKGDELLIDYREFAFLDSWPAMGL